MKQWILTSSLIIAMGSILMVNAYGLTGDATLTPGWDDSSFPLSTGRVLWSTTPSSKGKIIVRFVFELNGARPDHSFTAGIHFFEPEGEKLPNITQFGGKGFGGGKSTLSREGRTATLMGGWDFGLLDTDGLGNARVEFTYSVPNRPYVAQFTVRKGANCPAQGADCACVYRSGNKFAGEFVRFGSQEDILPPDNQTTAPPAADVFIGDWLGAYQCSDPVTLMHTVNIVIWREGNQILWTDWNLSSISPGRFTDEGSRFKLVTTGHAPDGKLKTYIWYIEKGKNHPSLMSGEAVHEAYPNCRQFRYIGLTHWTGCQISGKAPSKKPRVE
ncbi:MAG: hypothetical protein KKE44_14975 [Proteobacteria bacterium]|nr:hypothetical protein [Pseudomonadota bacterium]MBU1584030.1 hypothetical protein [Pseudomonadota bacterium]MBU2455061.1 hypothetical protein [Pseudomonadota bacterium]MBU2630886.1 hypothetical protein [Pseudomonadota bacterium]